LKTCLLILIGHSAIWILLSAKVGKIRFSQVDAEQVVKTIRKLEERLPRYNEINAAKWVMY
jgi:hypothetical protein